MSFIGNFLSSLGGGRDVEIEARNYEILKALGGPENLSALDACITKLRLTAQDTSRINESKLKLLGAASIVRTGNSLQIVFGHESDHIRGQIQKYIDKNGKQPLKQKVQLKSPLSGKILSLSQVPDQVFSQKIMGDGFAIEPTEGTVLAPTDATVVQIFRTAHAVGLETDNGIEILIHIGIDTVKLNGKGFTALVQNGQRVRAGQELIRFDLEEVRAAAPSLVSPIVFTNMERIAKIKVPAKGEAKAGEEIATLELQS